MIPAGGAGRENTSWDLLAGAKAGMEESVTCVQWGAMGGM